MRCVRDAPADVRSLVVELETLDELLTELNIVGFSTVDAPKVGDSRRGETLGNEDKHTARGPLSSTLRGRVTNCVRECTTVLQALQVKLKKFDFDKDGFVARLGKGVKWAHRKQDVEEVIRTLQKCKETLVLALHIESRYVGRNLGISNIKINIKS